MLLNYLYTHYHERLDFCAVAQIGVQQLLDLEADNIVPKASYKLAVNLTASSFVAEFEEQAKYGFYLKGQLDWVAQILNQNISTEIAARALFDAQYDAAIERFLAGELGEKIVRIFPQTLWELNDYTETWRHFTDGTYGLCTRTGLPNEIFLKHIYIRFIKFVTAANRPDEISTELKALLSAVVDDLDKNVESDFAPHEVVQSSRQSCIIDVRKKYLT